MSREIVDLHQRSRSVLLVAERRPLEIRPGDVLQVGELQQGLSITRDRFTISATLSQFEVDGIVADHVNFLSVRQGSPNLQLAEVMVRKKGARQLKTDVLCVATYGRRAASEAARREILDLQLPASLDDLLLLQMRFVVSPTGEISKGITASWNAMGDAQPELHRDNRTVTLANIELMSQTIQELERRFQP